MTATQVTELYNERSTGGETATLRWGYAWGHNGEGELMDGTNIQRNMPVKMPYFNRAGAKAIASGSNHNQALTTPFTNRCGRRSVAGS